MDGKRCPSILVAWAEWLRGKFMISIVAREIGVEDERPLLLVGIAESSGDEGRDFVFQCDLRVNEYQDGSNWVEGETYCVVNEHGSTSYGGVREIDFQGNVLRIVFDDKTIDALKLEDSEYEFRIEADLADVAKVRRYLTMILTCGRPEYRPQVFQIES